MNSMICNRPGCISMVVSDGARYCAVHSSDLSKARECDLCHGTGWYAQGMPCSRCGGTGLRDKSAHVPHAGRARRQEKVDERGLIKASE